MSKNFWKYPNITTRKKRFAKTLKSFFLILGFLCFVFGLVCLLAPMFNLKIFEHTQKEFCTTYYIVYANAKEDKDVFEYSQELRFRGAGGNIVEIDKTNVVVLNEYKTEEKAKKSCKNLELQDLNAQYYALDIKLNTKNFNQNQQKFLIECYQTQIEIFDKLIEHATNLDQKNISETDVGIEIFELYTRMEAVVLNNENDVDEKIKKYYQQALKIESLLYLLSQKEHKEDNISYSSLIRYYLFKILNTTQN